MNFELKTEDELNELLIKTSLSPMRKGYKIVKGCSVTQKYTEIEQEIEDLEVYDDDIWVITFPKCGTTWMQEIVWGITHNVDLSTAECEMNERFPFLEFSMQVDIDDPKNSDSVPYLVKSVETVKNSARPRFIKTHLPWDLLPKQIRTMEKKPKIIYVHRNVKDTCISYFYHQKLLECYRGTFEEFCQLFIGGKLTWCPFHKHTLDFYNRRHESHIHFVRFEDMKTELRDVIEKLSEFLDVALNNDQINKLMQHVHIDTMKNNKFIIQQPVIDYLKINNSCNNAEGSFIRSGKIGGHTSEMSPEIIAYFDSWNKKEFEGSEFDN